MKTNNCINQISNCTDCLSPALGRGLAAIAQKNNASFVNGERNQEYFREVGETIAVEGSVRNKLVF